MRIIGEGTNSSHNQLITTTHTPNPRDVRCVSEPIEPNTIDIFDTWHTEHIMAVGHFGA